MSAHAVMVSAGFVHLLGAAIKELNPGLQFPLAPFLCGLGFLVTLVADHVAEVLSHRNGWETPPGHCGGATLDGEMTRLQHVLVVDPVTPRRAGRAVLLKLPPAQAWQLQQWLLNWLVTGATSCQHPGPDLAPIQVSMHGTLAVHFDVPPWSVYSTSAGGTHEPEMTCRTCTLRHSHLHIPQAVHRLFTISSRDCRDCAGRIGYLHVAVHQFFALLCCTQHHPIDSGSACPQYGRVMCRGGREARHAGCGVAGCESERRLAEEDQYRAEGDAGD